MSPLSITSSSTSNWYVVQRHKSDGLMPFLQVIEMPFFNAQEAYGFVRFLFHLEASFKAIDAKFRRMEIDQFSAKEARWVTSGKERHGISFDLYQKIFSYVGWYDGESYFASLFTDQELQLVHDAFSPGENGFTEDEIYSLMKIMQLWKHMDKGESDNFEYRLIPSSNPLMMDFPSTLEIADWDELYEIEVKSPQLKLVGIGGGELAWKA